MAYAVIACRVMAYMAHIVMAYVVMAYVVMAYIVMAYIVMSSPCRRALERLNPDSDAMLWDRPRHAKPCEVPFFWPQGPGPF